MNTQFAQSIKENSRVTDLTQSHQFLLFGIPHMIITKLLTMDQGLCPCWREDFVARNPKCFWNFTLNVTCCSLNKYEMESREAFWLVSTKMKVSYCGNDLQVTKQGESVRILDSLSAIDIPLADNIIDPQGIPNTSRIVPQSLENRVVNIFLSSIHWVRGGTQGNWVIHCSPL